MLYLAETLANEHVALQQIDTDAWRVYFADVPLGILEGTRFRRQAAVARSSTNRPPQPKTEDTVSPMCPV